MLLTGGYYHKLHADHPTPFEYGYYKTIGFKINKIRFFWTMPMSATEVAANSDFLSFFAFAEPENMKQGVIHATVYFNGQQVDKIEWHKKELKKLYYHVPGITGKDLKISIRADNAYNPYLSGINKNIRRNREESIALSNIRFYQKPLQQPTKECIINVQDKI